MDVIKKSFQGCQPTWNKKHSGNCLFCSHRKNMKKKIIWVNVKPLHTLNICSADALHWINEKILKSWIYSLWPSLVQWTAQSWFSFISFLFHQVNENNIMKKNILMTRRNFFPWFNFYLRKRNHHHRHYAFHCRSHLLFQRSFKKQEGFFCRVEGTHKDYNKVNDFHVRSFFSVKRKIKTNCNFTPNFTYS